ncbi:MAG: tryptophan-rich sensory protein [Patescibacteria group bacterium]|nr:tryptophan-rich sensory protein [Patescibacteria group bacterium]
MKTTLPYLLIIMSVSAVALVGGWLTSLGIPDWYETLTLPAIAPGGSVIGTIWTIIFVLAAWAVMLMWRDRKKFNNFNLLLDLLLINAILNVGWSWVFFVQHALAWAVVEMIVLNLTTLIIIVWTMRKVSLAGWLLVPYFAWVGFATYLAYQIYILN